MSPRLHFLAISIAFTAAALRADEVANAGRAIIEKNREAVVTVHLLTEMNTAMFGQNQKQESKNEVQGTVIEADGLTVVPLMAVEQNLTEQIQSMLSGGGDEDVSEVTKQFGMKTVLKSVKISYADAPEVPATVVLRDKDLGLAFLQPAERLAKPAAAISLASEAKAALLDEVFVLGRMGEQSSYAPRVAVERIGSVIEKPRLSYVVSADPGLPVFLPQGQLLGIVGQRKMGKRDPQSGGGLFGMMAFSANAATEMFGTPVVIPASEVAESAKQAREAKSEQPQK